MNAATQSSVTEASTAPTRAEHRARMAAYLSAGEARGRAMDNRGPIRFDASGKLHPDIITAYWRHGFYIFEGAVAAEEVEALRADATNMLERAPVGPNSAVDTKGRPALGRDYARDP